MGALRKFLLSFVVFVAVCGAGLLWYVHYEVGRELTRAVAGVDGLDLAWKGLSVSILDPAVTLRGVEGSLPTGEHFTAESVRITSFDQRNPIPHYASAEARGVRMDRAPVLRQWWPGMARAVEGDDNPCDLALDYAYSPASKTLDIRTARLACPAMGRLEMNGSLTGLDFADHRMEQLIGLRIARADVSFTESALVDSLLRDTALALNTSEDAVRDQVCAELEAMADYAAKVGNPEAEQALRSFCRFVHAPGTLSLTARPSEPVPVPYFFMGRDIYDNIRLLGLSVTAAEKGDI
ncbi:MAG: hypothetical protein V3571_08715 [Pseudodesulfovibrio sp.]